MIEQQPRNEEKVGYKRERSEGESVGANRGLWMHRRYYSPQSKSHLVSTPLHSSQMILSHFRRKEAANRSLTGITLLYPKAERGGGGETQLAKDL